MTHDTVNKLFPQSKTELENDVVRKLPDVSLPGVWSRCQKDT